MSYLADEPIVRIEEDKLSRADFVLTLANSIQNAPNSKGFVITLNGEWGSGKSSIFNLVKPHLENDRFIYFDFSPWLINETNQILEGFMHELHKHYMSTEWNKLKFIRYYFRKYGKLISDSNPPIVVKLPIVGWFDSFIRWIGRLIANWAFQADSVEVTRAKLQSALRASSKKFVVFIDDIDRLGKDEILKVTKLVKLIADFPNLVYVLAYDEGLVGEAISESNYSGQDYLQKIVQQSINIPAITQEQLTSYTIDSVNELFEDFQDVLVFDQSHWANVYEDLVKPHLKNVREVKRLINGVRFQLNRFGSKINIVDLVALETLKLYKPSVHAGLISTKNYLHNPSYGLIYPDSHRNDEAKKTEVLSYFDGKDAQLATLALSHLFPATDSFMKRMSFGDDPQVSWLDQRRVAVKEIFELYASGTETESLFIKEQAKRLFESQGNPEVFAALLRSFSGTLLTQILDSLSSYRGKFSNPGMANNLLSILGAVPRMEEPDSGLFAFGTVTIARRAIVAMLGSIADNPTFRTICETVFSQLRSISASNIFVHTIESASQDSPEKLNVARELQDNFKTKVLAMTPAQLMAESDFISIIHSVPEFLEQHETDLDLSKKVFIDSIGVGKSAPMGSREVKTFQSVSWPSLTSIFRSEENVVNNLEKILASKSLSEKDRAKLEWILKNRGRMFPED